MNKFEVIYSDNPLHNADIKHRGVYKVIDLAFIQTHAEGESVS